MRSLISLSVLIASAAAFPPWNGFKNVVSKTSDDETSEKVPYEVVAELNGYEERKYPSVMYACTEMTYDTPEEEDSIDSKDWTPKEVLKWMSNKKSWKKKPQSEMFMKLFRYISGVNKDSQEIEMTSPVWSKMVVNTEDRKTTKDMCFYITKEFQSNPPEPIDPDVKIVKSDERIVYVKQFGGYAMEDSVWMKEAEKFKEELRDRKDEVDLSSFWTAGYDSPMKLLNRRNEVAFNKVNANDVTKAV